MDLTDVYRIFHMKIVKYTLPSSAQKTFSKVDHMLELKINLNNFKKLDIILSIFSKYNGIKLQINYLQNTK